MDKNGKSRHSVWLSDDVWREVDALYKLDNCPTRNEFVEKALRQYCGRLHAERTGAYLPRALQEVLEGTLGVFGDRLGRLLFKLVVEHNMTNHPLMTPDELKSIPKGSFVVMKTGTHPMQTKLRLFLDWGITFGEPYATPEHAARPVAYASRQELFLSISKRYSSSDRPIQAQQASATQRRTPRSAMGLYSEDTRP